MHDNLKIDSFINKINDLAEQAAQNVFDYYQEDFEKIVNSEKIKGAKLLQRNGTCCYKRTSSYTSNSPMSKQRDKFTNSISKVQYLSQRASFEIRDID